MEKGKSVVITNSNDKIIAICDNITPHSTDEVNVQILPREGQKLHFIQMPDEYHKIKMADEKENWLKDYIVTNDTLLHISRKS